MIEKAEGRRAPFTPTIGFVLPGRVGGSGETSDDPGAIGFVLSGSRGDLRGEG